MATIGGLEIHVEMFHAPPPAPEPELLVEPEPEPEPEPAAPVVATPRPATVRASSPLLRGYDPTIPLTALLVLTMLIAALGAAVHRSADPAHHALASLASGTSASSSNADIPPTTLAPVSHPPATTAPSLGDSPAAIPPAGSQSPTAAQPLTWDQQCQQLVDTLSNRNSKRTVDIGALIRSDTFPPLPLPGFEGPQVTDLGHFGTVQEMISGSDPSDPTTALWQQLMIQNGFVGEDQATFVNGDSSYSAAVYQFTTASGARTFNRGTLLNACKTGILMNAQVMPSLSGGMNYLITGEGPPFRATFVAGDTVVRLQICHCVQAPDDQALAGQWAQSVASHVGAS
jgi:hypothetical protein